MELIDWLDYLVSKPWTSSNLYFPQLSHKHMAQGPAFYRAEGDLLSGPHTCHLLSQDNQFPIIVPQYLK